MFQACMTAWVLWAPCAWRVSGLCLGTLGLPQPLCLVNSLGKPWPSSQPRLRCSVSILWFPWAKTLSSYCLFTPWMSHNNREQHNRLSGRLPSGIKMPGFRSLFPDVRCWPCVLGTSLNFLLSFLTCKMWMMTVMPPISYIWSEMKHVDGLA